METKNRLYRLYRADRPDRFKTFLRRSRRFPSQIPLAPALALTRLLFSIADVFVRYQQLRAWNRLTYQWHTCMRRREMSLRQQFYVGRKETNMTLNPVGDHL